MSKKNIHVVPHGKEWATRRERSNRVNSIHKTQRGAIQNAIPSAKKDKVEVVIHGRDGRIREKDSYGNDPNPPKDLKH